jgi:hypothetical protein
MLTYTVTLTISEDGYTPKTFEGRSHETIGRAYAAAVTNALSRAGQSGKADTHRHVRIFAPLFDAVERDIRDRNLSERAKVIGEVTYRVTGKRDSGYDDYPV